MHLNLSQRSPLLTVAALGLWMLLTRLPEASQWLHLRDASLAVFFLGGLLLRSPLAFAGFVALAFGIDAVVFARTDMLHLCLSPAYGFLIPAYGALWFTGRWLAPGTRMDTRGLVLTGAAGCAATVVSFAISNGAFYLLSGLFVDVSVSGFAEQFMRHAPGFVLTGWAWIAVGLCLIRLSRRESQTAAAQA
ncbi:hypothetical protein [Aquimonas voraii]|uniref:Uncharacterized protein n=1 Tax=Aquimonas voraii TaxID=265719 RepID=A0A1G6V0A0_9GAMM|nr:hypothetical protein [Aquimonas voraii]SDD46914.1 hypothetical protein SAMN04488509_102578 [Aquimonas voraii]